MTNLSDTGFSEERLRKIEELMNQDTPQSTMTQGASPSTMTDDRMAIIEKMMGGEWNADDFTAEVAGQKDMPPSESPVGLRALLSVFGDTEEEKKAAFKLYRPAGQLVRVPLTGEYIYKNTPDEEYKKLDPGFFESFKPGLGAAAQEFLADIADISGDVPETLGEIVALLGRKSPSKGVSQFFSDLTKSGVGAMMGEGFQQKIQDLIGTQRQAQSEQGQMMLGAGAESLIGSTLGEGVARTIGGISGRGFAGVTPQGHEAIEAAKRLGTKPLMASQVTDLGLVQAWASQSQALVPIMQRYLNEQEKRTAIAVKSLIDVSLIDNVANTISNQVGKAADNILQIVQTSVKNFQGKALTQRGSYWSAAGKNLQKGIKQWWEVSGKDINLLYETAKAIENPKYNLTNLKSEALSIEKGVPAFGGDGKIIQLRDLDPKLIDEINKIKQLNDNMDSVFVSDGKDGFVEITPTDQLRQIEKNLYDLTLAGPEGLREAQSIAIRLRSAVTDALNDPALTTDAGRKAWKTARAAAKKRFDTREHIAVVDAVNSQLPADLSRALAKPNNIDRLVVLRGAVSQEYWDKFVDGFKYDLLKDPYLMGKKLDDFDDATLNVLLTPLEQNAFRDASEKLGKLNAPEVMQLVDDTNTVRGFISTLFGNKEANRAGVLRELVFNANVNPGGKTSSFGKTVRSAIVDEIYHRSMVVERGVEVLDYNKLTRVLNEFDELGLLRLLDKTELQVLRDAQLVQDFSRSSADAGTSLARASAAQEARTGSIRAMWTIVENMTVGRILTNEYATKFLTGSGKQMSDARMARILGQIATSLVRDAEDKQRAGKRIQNTWDAFGRLASDGFAAFDMSKQ